MHKTPFPLRRFASVCVEVYGAEVTLSIVPETCETLSGAPYAGEKVYAAEFFFPYSGAKISYAEATDEYVEKHIVPAITTECLSIKYRVVLRAIQVAMIARSRPENLKPEDGSLAAHISTLPGVLLQLVTETALSSFLRSRNGHTKK